MAELQEKIEAIIGLGNTGSRFDGTRHNIGFAVIDYVCQLYGGTWRNATLFQEASIQIDNHLFLLVKPNTFMNNSGQVFAELKKRDIQPNGMLVIHDELELPFGTIKYRFNGSARGHNGLRSLINAMGPTFGRIRCGIGRPAHKEDIPHYVLTKFTESADVINAMIQSAADRVVKTIVSSKKVNLGAESV